MAYDQSMYIIYGDGIYELKVHDWAVKQIMISVSELHIQFLEIIYLVLGANHN